MKSSKTIIGIILSVIIGGLVGFILMLIASEGLFVIVTCAIASMIIAGIVAGVTDGMELSKLFSVFAFIASFILYFCLLSHINESNDVSTVFALIVSFLPYIVLTYLLLVVAERKGE